MKKFLNIIKKFFQGAAVGIANVIPGFSGGTMAVIFNIYDELLTAFSEFFKKPIKVIKNIWPVVLGLLFGVVVSIVAIVKLLEYAPLATVMFFVGLIIGSIPFIYIKTKKYDKPKYFDFIGLFIALIILIVLPFIKGNTIVIEFNFWLVIVVFMMGIICAATMVIPGISGSLVLMIFGYYFYIIGTLKEVISSLISLDFNGLVYPVIISLSFGVGCVFGLVVISKIIKKLLQLCPKTVYYVILGFLLASPFSIIYAVIKEYPDAFNQMNFLKYFISLLTLVLGVFISTYFSRYENNRIKNDNE